MVKKIELNTMERYKKFWLIAGILVILLCITLSRDIARPFTGLHSWKEAATAWRARSYFNYDLSYTKGLALWEVGAPSDKVPSRSLDHPQLGLFLPAIDMLLFGKTEAGIRVGGVIQAVLVLIILLKILRGLLDDKTALLAGLLFVIFPLTAYFGTRGWVTVVGLLSTWYYLIITNSVKNAPDVRRYHKWLLAILLFLILQLNWEGFFYAMAIGIHYVCRCVFRKQWPDLTLLLILILAPFTSLALNFAVLGMGHDWDWGKIWSLYQWRASKGEMSEFVWGSWFAKMWEFAKLNFTLPILILSIGYLTIGQLFVFMENKQLPEMKLRKHQFPQFWLILMPALFQLFILRGALWKHQYWESPLAPFICVAASLAIMLLYDGFAKIHKFAANLVFAISLLVITIFCISGTNYYYDVRWQADAKIEMFKRLNSQIPPDKKLLSFDDFIVNQHPVKGPHYRPEIAWYLDRNIDQAQNLEQIQKVAQSGQYPFYLMPINHYNQKATNYLRQLAGQLRKYYKYEHIPGSNSKMDKDGKFLRAGMSPYIIFDLNSSVKD